MNKAELRKHARLQRQAMDEASYFEKSRSICDYFFTGFDLNFIHTLHVFLPMTERREPDLWPLIDRLRREFPAVRISIPKMAGEVLESFYFEGIHQLTKNSFGVVEPKQGIPTPVEKIDMVLVPVLLADRQGHRLGYGKGYYDRFLKDCRQNCLKVGISILPLSDPIPFENHDVRLTHLITPDGIIRFE